MLLRNGGGRNFERRKGIKKMNGIEGGKSVAWETVCLPDEHLLEESGQRAWVSSKTQRDTLTRTGLQTLHCGGLRVAGVVCDVCEGIGCPSACCPSLGTQAMWSVGHTGVHGF